MDYASCRSLPAMFFEVATQRAARPFLWAKRDGKYHPLSWGEAADAVRRLARGLAALGIEAGDRVALIAENRPEWVIADLAIMAAGAVTVPAYVTNTIDDHRHILGNSGARAAIVSTASLAGRLIPAAAQVPSVRVVIAIEDVGEAPQGLDLHRWDSVLALGDESGDERLAALTPDDTACLIYTSGTGGVPKGVMLSHRNIIANCRGAYRLLEMLGLGDDKFLSFLPLSHSYEHTAGMMFPISLGAEIYFAEGAETLATNLIEVRPTIMTAVPRLYETMHQRIRLGIEREHGLKRTLFERAVAIGRKRLAGEPLSVAERLIDPVLDRLVRDKVRARFGGHLKAMISGGAPLNPEIGGFFLALGVQLLQGYGQTEADGRPAARRGGSEDRRGWRDPRRRRQCHERLLERPRGERTNADRRLAAHRRYRRSRPRRLSAHHRPEARFHQEFGGRHDLAGAGRGRPHADAGNRPGDGVRRPPALSRRGDRPRPGVRGGLRGQQRHGPRRIRAGCRPPQGARRCRCPGQ